MQAQGVARRKLLRTTPKSSNGLWLPTNGRIEYIKNWDAASTAPFATNDDRAPKG
jgi:hypothetical protein